VRESDGALEGRAVGSPGEAGSPARHAERVSGGDLRREGVASREDDEVEAGVALERVQVAGIPDDGLGRGVME